MLLAVKVMGSIQICALGVILSRNVTEAMQGDLVGDFEVPVIGVP